jgi:hypothetical protein
LIAASGVAKLAVAIAVELFDNVEGLADFATSGDNPVGQAPLIEPGFMPAQAPG